MWDTIGDLTADRVLKVKVYSLLHPILERFDQFMKSLERLGRLGEEGDVA
mgnify:CR=1 FL=1